MVRISYTIAYFACMLKISVNIILLFLLGQFLRLDVDEDGLLSRQELSKHNSGTLTDIFFDRVFQGN
jgi:hypothetical protein